MEPAPHFVRAARRAAVGELRSRANSAGPVLRPEERWELEQRAAQLTAFLRSRGGEDVAYWGRGREDSVYLAPSRAVLDYRRTNEQVHQPVVLAPGQVPDLILPATQLDEWIPDLAEGFLRLPDLADAYRTLNVPDWRDGAVDYS